MIRHRDNPPTSFDTETGILIRNGDVKPVAPELIDYKCTSTCHANCQFCFPSGTKIFTPDGEIPIEDINVGQRVYAYDENSGQKIETEVLEKYSRKYHGDLISIELESGTVIELTPEHEVFTSNRGWIQAGQIQKEDDLLEF